MRDVTAELMGDPGSSPRRSPTPKDLDRVAADRTPSRWRRERLAALEAMPVGGTMSVESESARIACLRWFLRHGRRGTSWKAPDGLMIERVV